MFQLFFVLLQCFRFVRKLLLLEEIIIINNHIIFSSTIETISSTILLFFLPSSGEASRLKPITTFVATLVCYSLVDRCSSLRRVLKLLRRLEIPSFALEPSVFSIDLLCFQCVIFFSSQNRNIGEEYWREWWRLRFYSKIFEVVESFRSELILLI